MPPKVGRVASDGKRVFEPSRNDSPLGQNMGEPWADGPPAYIMDDSHVSRRFPTWYLKIGRGFTQFTTRRQERQSERRASNLFTTFLTSPPDLERFFQASKRQVPPFSVKSVNPSVNLPHLQQYIREDAIGSHISEASMAGMSQAEGMCGSHSLVHTLLSDGLSSAFMHLHTLSVWRSHSRSHPSDARREERSAYFGRGYGSAANCHTFFRFCHTLLPLAVSGSKAGWFAATICFTEPF